MKNINEYDTFGDFLREYRKERGINSKDLAREANKGAAYISQIENGRITNPDYNTAYDILRILGVDEDIIKNILRTFHIIDPTGKKDPLEEALYQSALELMDLNDPDAYDGESSLPDEVFEEIHGEITKTLSILLHTKSLIALKTFQQVNKILNESKEEIALKYSHKMLADPDFLERIINMFKEDKD